MLPVVVEGKRLIFATNPNEIKTFKVKLEVLAQIGMSDCMQWPVEHKSAIERIIGKVNRSMNLFPHQGAAGDEADYLRATAVCACSNHC